MTQSNLTPIENQVIPEGYKKTELGLIPEDWMLKPFEEVTSKIGDGIHSTPVYSSTGEYYFVNGNNLVDGKVLIDGETKKISSKEFRKYKQSLSEKTILLSINGTIGNRAFYNAEPVLLGKSAAFINVNSECNLQYIYYVLGSKITLDQFNDGLTGSTIKNLGLGTIRNTLIPVPILPEQERIATALSDTDALTSELEKLIEKKQAIKTATMQQLLTGKTRLPEFALREDGTPKGYKDSELGQIPEDWDIKRLGDITIVKTGGTPSTVNSQYWNGGYLWCTPTDITALKGNKYLTSTSRTLSKLGIENSSAEVLPIDTIVMSSRATIGECAILKKHASTNQGFKNFICFEDTSNEYLYYLLTTLKQDFIGLCSGSTFLEISTTQVRNFKVKIPRFDEQLAISKVLSEIDSEIVKLNLKLRKVKKIKQGMMQELLTGKTRLV